MYVYMERRRERYRKREREFLKKRENHPPAHKKPTREMRASSRFLFFKNQGGGRGGGAFGTNNTNLRTNRFGI
jgi:hypothetical protein